MAGGFCFRCSARRPGAPDRVRKRRSFAACTRTAAATGICGADRNGHGPHRPSATDFVGEFAAGDVRRSVGSWVSHFRRKSVQGDCRACCSAPRWSNSRLGSFGVGTWGGVARCIFCGSNSGAARLSVESDGSAERCRAEGNGGNGREAAAARGRDAANRIDAGAAGRRGAADSHHDKNRAGSVGI